LLRIDAMRHVIRRFRFVPLLAVGMITAGCAGPGELRPPAESPTKIPLPARFIEAPREAARSTFGNGPWWSTLADRDLDRSITASLAGNFGLREAESRVRVAAASLRQARARLFPSLDASGEVSDRWDSGGGGSGSDTPLGVLLDWEADVFGRMRAARRAGTRELAATRGDLAGARLLLSAAVAETHFARVEQVEQLRLLEEQTAVGETLLRLTRLRFGQGQASIVDVLQQEEQLKATRALVPVVEARIAELGYALDAFLGRPPGKTPPPRGSVLPEPPKLPATGLPSDLLLRRPDLVAARERLRALDARLVEAIAAQFPRFRISASAINARGGAPSLTAGLAASVVAPLFDAGDRRAEVMKRRAELEGAVAAFGQLFLEALRDVESALLNERQQTERLGRQQTQLETAKRLLTETRNRYSQGLTDYLPVLAALTTVQRLEREIVTTRRNRISQRIALHRALGGPMN
jgi:NodT family efflux transporter outer membrane factor (OMF) lipoprotein